MALVDTSFLRPINGDTKSKDISNIILCLSPLISNLPTYGREPLGDGGEDVEKDLGLHRGEEAHVVLRKAFQKHVVSLGELRVILNCVGE